MHWTHLGHAGWLAEAGETRLLFDPLLGETHYGGVFETVPRRRLRPEALRPDFVLISHGHPDHFDVESLVELARHDADAVLLSPDPFVCETARRAGFRNASVLDPGKRLELQDAVVVATPSLATEPECGFLVATHDACVWNMVDSVYSGPEHVQQLSRACRRAAGSKGLDLALVRFQPLKEVDAVLGQSLGFPFRDYDVLLREAMATEAGTLMTSSAGVKHTAAYADMNALVYPVLPARFARDLATLAPDRQVVTPGLAERFLVAGGAVTSRGVSDALIDAVGEASEPEFHPTALPALRPGPSDPAGLLAEIEQWVDRALCPGLSNQKVSGVLLLVLEVLTADGPTPFAIELDARGARRSERPANDYDLLNQTTAGALVSVIRGQASWGELLLSGRLRVSDRAYTLGPGLQRVRFLPTFVYFGASYAATERSAALHRLERALRKPEP
jgi:hypothetical protein